MFAFIDKRIENNEASNVDNLMNFFFAIDNCLPWTFGACPLEAS